MPATIATFVASLSGPVILVGHSCGGAVIGAASPSTPNERALVYVDGFALDAGESPLSLLSADPSPPPGFFVQVPVAGGGDADVSIAQKYYGAVFASDVPAAVSSIMAVTQRPLTGSALNEPATAAQGWKTFLRGTSSAMRISSFRPRYSS